MHFIISRRRSALFGKGGPLLALGWPGSPPGELPGKPPRRHQASRDAPESGTRRAEPGESPGKPPRRHQASRDTPESGTWRVEPGEPPPGSRAWRAEPTGLSLKNCTLGAKPGDPPPTSHDWSSKPGHPYPGSQAWRAIPSKPCPRNQAWRACRGEHREHSPKKGAWEIESGEPSSESRIWGAMVRDLDLERHSWLDRPGDPNLDGHAWAENPISSPTSSKGEVHPCCPCWAIATASRRARHCAKSTGASQPFLCICPGVRAGWDRTGTARMPREETAASPWGGLELQQLPPHPRWGQ